MPIGKSRRSLQQRAVRKDGWTIAKRKIFLDTLAATCNVTRAVEATGMNVQGLYRLKERDGEFAGLWQQALAQGVERIEEQLLAHTMGAPTGENPGEERDVIEPVPFDPLLALKVLQWRRDIDGPRRTRKQPFYAKPADVDAALMARLDALAKRLGNS